MIERDVVKNIIPNGIHYLSGVERICNPSKQYCRNLDIDGIRLIIDGKVFECYNDPFDGYRSYGALYLVEDDTLTCKYKFPPQEVSIKWEDTADDGSMSINTWKMTLSDPSTSKEVLVVGTEFYDDYYPLAIFSFTPENMKINIHK